MSFVATTARILLGTLLASLLSSTGHAAPLPTQDFVVSVALPENLADDRVNVGTSHNVFLARIIREVGVVPTDTFLPVTRFEVEVLLNIKGELRRRVFVEQQGGVRNGVLLRGLTEETMSNPAAAALLKPGATYFPATSVNTHRLEALIGRGEPNDPGSLHWLDLAPQRRMLVTTNESLGATELLALAGPRAAQLRFALATEITLEQQRVRSAAEAWSNAIPRAKEAIERLRTQSQS